MNYDVDYFIRKFEAIPEDKWCVGQFENIHGQKCVLGHCGLTSAFDDTEETAHIREILGYDVSIGRINDGHDFRFTQPTPRARILAALRDVKEKGAK